MSSANCVRRLFFAVNDYSLSAWAIVDTRLFYLFIDLKKHHYFQVGVISYIQANSRLLSANLEAAIESLRLC